MASYTRIRRGRLWLTAMAVAVCAAAGPAWAGSLRVVTTVPNLAALAQEVGGDDISVRSLGRSREDPHFVDARPSFIHELNRANVLARIGLGLEIGWVPVLVRKARNSALLPGGVGDFDAARGIPLLQVMTGQVDRSMGDVHPDGNPHYLLDPLNGVRTARRMRDLFSRLEPAAAAGFARRTSDFENRLFVALCGQAIVDEVGAVPLANAALSGDFDAWLREQGLADRVGGWLAVMKPYRGKQVIADHDLWPYFATRFGITVAGFLEPVPGITPTTRHLSQIAKLMKAEGIRPILSAAYFHPRYAEKVASAVDGVVLRMANQVGAADGTDDYLSMLDYNVKQVAGGF